MERTDSTRLRGAGGKGERNLNEEDTKRFLKVLPNCQVDGSHLIQEHCRSMSEFIQEFEAFLNLSQEQEIAI